jgi:secreted trypsin-like serine protease
VQQVEISARLAGQAADTRVLGWGVTEPSGEGPLPTQLQELDTRLAPADQCAASVMGITEGEICVANVSGTDGLCYGDSGGPALQKVTAARRQLIASTSRATDEHCGTGPTIYTSTVYYRDWLYQVMRTGTVPPRTEGVQAATALVVANAHQWMSRSGSR